MNKTAWIIINIIAAIVPVFLIKKYLISNNYGYLILTILFYTILMISYINMFRYAEISSIYPFLQIVQILAAIVLSVLIFKEHITTDKIIGILLGLGSLYLLSKKD